MAITYKELIFLKYCSKKNSFRDTLCLGNQSIAYSSGFKDVLPGSSIDRNTNLLDLLKIAFGSLSLETVDVSNYEGASLIYDLNNKINIDKKFDTTIDIGTSYFIYDVKTCFQNIINLTKIGESIIHVLPSNNFCNLGLYQFSPDFFYQLYSKKNGFTNTEVFVSDYSNLFFNKIYKLNYENHSFRNFLPTKGELVTWVRTEKKEEIKNFELKPILYETYNVSSKNNITKLSKKKVHFNKKGFLFKSLRLIYYSLKIDYLKELLYELKIKIVNNKSLFNKKLFTKVDKKYFLD